MAEKKLVGPKTRMAEMTQAVADRPTTSSDKTKTFSSQQKQLQDQNTGLQRKKGSPLSVEISGGAEAKLGEKGGKKKASTSGGKKASTSGGKRASTSGKKRASSSGSKSSRDNDLKTWAANERKGLKKDQAAQQKVQASVGEQAGRRTAKRMDSVGGKVISKARSALNKAKDTKSKDSPLRKVASAFSSGDGKSDSYKTLMGG